MSRKKSVEPGKGKHLTAAERISIEAGIKDGSRINEIAARIHKDPTTVSKEIRRHRVLNKPCTYPVDCLSYSRCPIRRNNAMACSGQCPSYIHFRCVRRDHSPGACNGCSRIASCHFDKYQYKAGPAQHRYRETLVSTRRGLNLTPEEGEALATVVSPLIRQGQSPYMIVTAHPELGVCSGTLYNYIHAGLMAPYGITDASLPLKTKRSPIKKKSSRILYKKKQSRAYLTGRTYDDYKAFLAQEENRYSWVLQLDTVYNCVETGPFMETMLFTPCTFLMAFFQEERTCEAMVSGIDRLESLLGKDLFEETAGIILTDRGTEFTSADRFELRTDGTRRAHIFYCDPMASCQKPNVENSHELLRRALPKNSDKSKDFGMDYTDLRSLGLTCQEALNLVLSHINSVPRLSLDGKTPIQVMQFKKPQLWKKLQKFGIRRIPSDKVVLHKSLLRAFRTGITPEDLEPEPPDMITNTVKPKLKKRTAKGNNGND